MPQTAYAAKPQFPLQFTLPLRGDHQAVMTPDACAFIAELAERFGERRDQLLGARSERQRQLDAGALPDFLPETKSIRESDWQVAPIPAPLLDRRVEITGPAERKMMINALNSGAKIFMCDLEDSLSPTFAAIMQAHVNLRDYASGMLHYASPEGKVYKPDAQTAVMIVRPRGWHLDEKHVLVNGKPIAASLFDFGVYVYTNAQKLIARGVGPYVYLPKLEHHAEAKLWADVFAFSEEKLGLLHGTIKATVLLETVLASFQMEEILYALKDYCAGLNCGRWDYIFSFIKKFAHHPDFVLPDRAQVTMTTHFLRSYSQLVIKTCHKRGAFAIGGMSAYIPVRGDEAANTRAFAMVRADKEREALDGHDGTWVAHPGLVPVAMEVFNAAMPTPNQLTKMRDDIEVGAKDLLQVPQGEITEAGLRNNISVSVQYIAAWLTGQGCVPINNLMEDAATAEIARSQIWQWIHHEKGILSDGRNVTPALYQTLLAEELARIHDQFGEKLPYARAAALVTDLVSQNTFTEFLTLPGYALLAD